MYAPIALFVYSRPAHTRRTVEALLGNVLAAESDLIVFADGPRDERDASAVAEVAEYLGRIEGFRSVNVRRRSRNLGLATSLTRGIGEVLADHDRIIVLEDDIVTSPGFLGFMNRSLDRYQGVPEVWHVSGWNYPIDPRGLGDSYFTRVMNCWGWGTWKDRWRNFSREPRRLLDSWDASMVERFDLGAECTFWKQVVANANGELDTWAVFWYATIFEQSGLCLNPSRSLVENIGLDGTGQHCGRAALEQQPAVDRVGMGFPEKLLESPLGMVRIADFCRRQRQPGYRRWLSRLRGLCGAPMRYFSPGCKGRR